VEAARAAIPETKKGAPRAPFFFGIPFQIVATGDFAMLDGKQADAYKRFHCAHTRDSSSHRVVPGLAANDPMHGNVAVDACNMAACSEQKVRTGCKPNVAPAPAWPIDA